MITPFNRHFWGLPLPVILIVRRDTRKVTLRTLGVWSTYDPEKNHTPPLTQAEVNRLLNEHAQVAPSSLFPQRPIPGELLRDDLAGKTFEELGGSCLDLDSGIGASEWADRTAWMWPLPFSLSGRPGAPFNIFIETFETKAKTPRLLDTTDACGSLEVYVPFKACDFTECSFSLCLNQEYGLLGNQPMGIEVTYDDVRNHVQKPFPQVVLSSSQVSISSDAYESVVATITDGNGAIITDASADLYIESSGGYVPKTKITTVNGQATIRFGALGLTAGDTFQVKVGFRHYSNVAAVAVTVT